MKILVPIVASVVLASCAGSSSLPASGSSKYLHSTGGGMAIEGGSKPFAFGAGVELLSGAPVPAYATVRFENPENPAKPFVSNHTFSQPGSEISILTPSFGRVTNSRNYTYTVDLYSDRARQTRIDQLTQSLRVDIPQPLIQARGLQDRVN